MYRLLPLVAMLLLTGCSACLPPYLKIVDSPYPHEDVVEAVDDFSVEWEDAYDQDIRGYLEDITIRFYGKTQEEWSTVGCYRGTTSSQYRINVAYVSDVEEWPLDKTAFWHELTHLVLWNDVNDPDRSHEEPPGPWRKHHNELVARLKTNWRLKHDPEI